MDLGIEDPAQIHQKSIQKVIKNKMRFWMHLGLLLERFLMDFGPKLGVKLEPSWHQNRRKWGTMTMSKNHQKSGDAVVRNWYAGGTRWWGVLAPKNTPNQVPQGQRDIRNIRNTPSRAQGPGADTYTYAYV